MSATNEDGLATIIAGAGLTEENAEKARLIFEHAVSERVGEELEDRVYSRVDAIDEAIQEYMEQAMAQAINESEDELRKLMILCVSEIAGPDAVKSFIAKVAALARQGV